MWYCKIVDGAINCFADSDKVPIGDGMIPLPEGLTPENVKLVDGELVKDPDFDSARLDAQWASVRSQQRDLLYKSDWTCSVTDYEVPNKSDWIQYRAQLREVTTQDDPFNIVWPTSPQ